MFYPQKFYQRNKKLPILVASSLLCGNLLVASDYVNLGVRGNTHEIREVPFDIQIREQYTKEFKKEETIRAFEKAYTNSLIVNGNIPTCELSTQKEFTPVFTLDEDIKMPYSGEILYKAGMTYNVLKEQQIFFNKYIIVIDATDDTQVKLAKEYAEYADIMITNGDVGIFLNQGINAFVLRDKLEGRALNLECVPSIYTQQQDKFIINQYNPLDLKGNL